MLVVNARIRIPLNEIRFSFARSSGPGGQNVNKVNSKAILRWSVTTSPSLSPVVRQRVVAKHRRRITAAGELVIASQRFRDAGRNMADCLDKLRRMVDDGATPVKTRKPTRPSRKSRRRRLEMKRRRSQKKRLRGGFRQDD